MKNFFFFENNRKKLTITIIINAERNRLETNEIIYKA